MQGETPATCEMHFPRKRRVAEFVSVEVSIVACLRAPLWRTCGLSIDARSTPFRTLAVFLPRCCSIYEIHASRESLKRQPGKERSISKYSRLRRIEEGHGGRRRSSLDIFMEGAGLSGRSRFWKSVGRSRLSQLWCFVIIDWL